MNTKSVTIRMPIDLYKKYINIALRKSKKNKKILSLSKVIIDALELQSN